MDPIQAIILGFIQGVTEWLPISSEGMVAVFISLVLKGVDAVDFALFLHLGTLLAVLVYFRKDWLEVLSMKNKPLFRFLSISTLISLPFGFLFYETIGEAAVGAGLLAITGLGLLATSFFQKKRREEAGTFWSLDKLALAAGFLQGLSVIPGLSRSGSTVFALSLGKLSPQEVLRLSYMMSAPAVLASTAFLVANDASFIPFSWPALLFSFLAGLFFLRLLIGLSQRTNFSRFTLVFGLLCLAGAALEAIM